MTLSEYAKTWVGKRFNGNATEQCMLFVRHCLIETKSPLAHKVTDFPIDGLPTSFALASSLAGKDCGLLTTNPKPEGLLFFQNTYGDWPTGTITHIGIPIGDGKFVHRPTSSRPVEEASYTSGYWAGALRCGLIIQPVESKSRHGKWFMHDDKANLFLDDKPEPNKSAFEINNFLEPNLKINRKGRKLVAAKVEFWWED